MTRILCIDEDRFYEYNIKNRELFDKEGVSCPEKLQHS